MSGSGAGSGPAPWAGHEDPESLGDLAEGLLPEPEAARGREHVAACSGCAELERDLRHVRELLGALPDPGPVPTGVAERVREALATEAPAGSGGARAGGAAVPAPGPRAAPPHLRGVPAPGGAGSRARTARRALAGLAAAAAAALLAVPLLDGLAGTAGEDSTASSGGASGAAEGGGGAAVAGAALVSSGRDYRDDDLPDAPAVLAALSAVPEPTVGGGTSPGSSPGALPPPASDAPASDAPASGAAPDGVPDAPGAQGAAAPDPRLLALRDPAVLERCLAELALAGRDVTGPVAGVDLARFEGAPAAVVVAGAADPALWTVLVVAPGCGSGTAVDVLAAAQAPR